MAKASGVDEAIERLVRKRLPPGGEPVLARVDDGPPQRGILYRTAAPFPPLARKLKAPNGETFKIQVSCSADGYVLVTWGA